jgi:predicted O-methyltransferase YrrM
VEPQKMQQIRDLLAALSGPQYGIHYHGWVKKQELAEAWQTSDIWFYPCTFMETFCLTALEAASSQTFVVTNDLAALQNTVGNRGCIIPGDPTTKEWQEQALQQLFYYFDLTNTREKQKKIEENYQWASTLSWESQAQKLMDTYLLPNMEIEYKGMYNWTNDVPYGEKQVFLDVLQYFNKTHNDQRSSLEVLEIGTYTGVSLIEIIKTIPNAKGTGVDLWTSYNENNLLENMDALAIEQSFKKNVSTAGLTHKIRGFKCDSTEALLEFFADRKYFDFIYVDGSHLLLDCYCDLVLAWNILHKYGILAIDDYTYKQGSLLESPFEAVNHFLKRYEGEYKVLYKGYRVFLEKI